MKSINFGETTGEEKRAYAEHEKIQEEMIKNGTWDKEKYGEMPPRGRFDEVKDDEPSKYGVLNGDIIEELPVDFTKIKDKGQFVDLKGFKKCYIVTKEGVTEKNIK